MSKDYKQPVRRSSGQSSSLFVGILIGLVLGLVIALGVAWYISKMPSPFTAKPSPPPVVKPDSSVSAPTAPKADEKASSAKDDKPRFTFPDILTKGEEAATDQQIKDAQKKSTGAAKETFFLQAGAFQNAPDADNLKARLAMVGIEASIQTSTLADKGVWHRVRVGPYRSLDEVNAMRNQLKQNGVEASLIRVRDTEK